MIRHNARPLVLNAYLESFLCVKNTKPAARAKGSRLEDVGLGDELGDELAASLARPFLSADSQAAPMNPMIFHLATQRDCRTQRASGFMPAASSGGTDWSRIKANFLCAPPSHAHAHVGVFV